VRASITVAHATLPLLVIALLDDASFVFVYVFCLPTYLPTSLGSSAAVAAGALSAYGISRLLTQLAAGISSDILGTKRSLVIGLGLRFAATLAILILAHLIPWAIVGAAFLDGLGGSILGPAVYSAAMAKLGADQRATFFSAFALRLGMAALLGLGIGAAVGRFADFDTAMLIPLAWLGVAVATTLLTPYFAGVVSRRIGSLNLGQLRLLVATRPRLTFALMELVLGSSLGALGASFVAYGRDFLNVSFASQLLLLAPAAVVAILAVSLGGALIDRSSPKRFLVFGFSLASVCMVVLSATSEPLIVVATSILGGLAFGLAYPAAGATRLNLADSSLTGAMIGLFLSANGLGLALGPAAAGVLLAVSGVRSVLWMMCGLYAVIALLTYVVYSNDGQDKLRSSV